MACSKGSSQREVHNNKGLPQKTTRISNKQPNLHIKELEKETKPKATRRKEVIKSREDIRIKKKKKTEKNLLKLRAWSLKG